MAHQVQYRPTMIRTTRRRLQLSTETLRVLGGSELGGVLGGNTSPGVTESWNCKETDACPNTTFVPTIPPQTVRCK
jgi:hypothetical protein